MTARLFAGVLLAATLATGVSARAAGDHWNHDDARLHARQIARAVRDGLRDARREIRHALREAGRSLRQSTREFSGYRQPSLGSWKGDSAERRAARDRDRTARALRQASPTDDPCARDVGSDRGRACEVRDTRLPALTGPLTVDASPNGGIRVEGWDEADVLVRAVVQTYAESDAEARTALPQVRVIAAGTRVAAEGPGRANGERRSGWSVSFRIWAPRATALALSAKNGGISVHAMRGESRFATENGGVTLDDVGGEVVGTTRNGGVTVRLSGARWEGVGLDVETTNGGVTLAVPANYSASLDVRTVNGGIRADGPIATPDRGSRGLRTTLGSGGPLLRLRTVNGGVRINAR